MPSQQAGRRTFEATASMVTTVKMSDEDAAWLYPDLGQDAVIDAVLSLGRSSSPSPAAVKAQ